MKLSEELRKNGRTSSRPTQTKPRRTTTVIDPQRARRPRPGPDSAVPDPAQTQPPRETRMPAERDTTIGEPSKAPPKAPETSTRFEERLRRGRVAFCADCGNVMTKSTRMILSPFSAVVLTLLGFSLMVMYGLAVNFFQTPWYLKFSLPAMYYIGSIFLGVGVLFFFVRERVWKCPDCRSVRKR